ncbi:YncE family protein [Colwellia sp. RSH04]|uniref:YncE family protein n=1 Tax=Colwellia sp. RSH04 TaxID=2305464 RepID=UPI000E5780AA|nr:hypothetical protein [Colwellia sp. RSH04]RHW74842.1 hypothetical protein D1094_16980 [Colwellia sp. RSH04]
MKIFKCVDSLAVYAHPKPDAQQQARLYANNGYFENGQFTYQSYNDDFKYGQFYLIDEQVYRRVDKLTGKKTKKLLNEAGKQPDLPSFFLNTITEEYIFPSEIITNKVTVSLNDYPDDFDKSLVLFDLVTKQSQSMPSYSTRNAILNNAIYSMEDRDRSLLKRDFNLGTIWQYNIDSSARTLRLKYAFIDDGLFITFIGPAEESMQVVNGNQEKSFSGGELIGFNDIDGSVAWRLDIADAVDEIKQIDGQLFIASLAQVLIVDSQTGKLVHTIETGTSTPIYRVLAVNLHVDEQYIYYTNAAENSLFIYNASTYQQVKKIAIPEGYNIRGCSVTDKLSGKHYFSVVNRLQYVARSALLELDPNNLTDEISLEPEPDHTITLVPTSDNSDELELQITLNCASLDDALRFGEIYTRDYAQWHSHAAVSRTFVGREANPNFNGIIRFIYSGSEKSDDVVKEHLAIMEKRFARWIDGEGFYAQPSTSNKNELTRLIAVYQ